MNWRHLFDTARRLAGLIGDSPAPIGRPHQADLRRAVSTAYYAMFHALCTSNADTLIGTVRAGPQASPWLQAYRALDHGTAKTLLSRYGSQHQASIGIRAFATAFSNLQEQRHDADYNPKRAFTRPEVERLLDRMETTAHAFWDVPLTERRDLAAYLLLSTKRTRGA